MTVDGQLTAHLVYDLPITIVALLVVGGSLLSLLLLFLLSEGALTVIFSFFFGMPDFRIHLAFSGILAISLALVIVLILALDRPFRGDLAISTEGFEEIGKGIVP
ncbi:MAG TPA: hypothetical protein VF207_06240, partial [Chthoniobacterales bacterium]